MSVVSCILYVLVGASIAVLPIVMAMFRYKTMDPEEAVDAMFAETHWTNMALIAATIRFGLLLLQWGLFALVAARAFWAAVDSPERDDGGDRDGAQQ